ncbi:hypothetical protein HRED_10936, partial [Candidatus Haloredivivus sp. G17]
MRESIENKGLKTRDDTNMPAQHLDAPSHEDKVYFSTEDGYVNAGRGMTEKIGGMPIGLFQAYLNPDNLVRDEDTSLMHDYSESGLDQNSFYLISLATLGNMAHQGNIYPNQDSAPPGESFIVDWKTYNEDGIRPPNFVLDQFKSRIRAAEKGNLQKILQKLENAKEAIIKAIPKCRGKGYNSPSRRNNQRWRYTWPYRPPQGLNEDSIRLRCRC